MRSCAVAVAPQEELKNLMAIADVDGDGLIDYNEFVAATMHVSKLEKEELLQKVGVPHRLHAVLTAVMQQQLQASRDPVCSTAEAA